MKPVWIIDDDRSIRWVFEKALTRENIAFKTFSSAQEALAALGSTPPQVVVSDIRMPGSSGLELLQQIKTRFPNLPVIIMTAYSDLESAVAAFQGGAFEYLPKPFDVDQAVDLIRRAMEESLRQSDVPEVAEESPEILGQAPSMQEVFRAIGRLTQSHATVLINGESGTGKELVARALHRHSPRAAEAVHRHQHRGDPEGAARIRAVRPRARRVHRRAGHAPRPLRTGRGRHAVPRRDRRHAAGPADPPAARAVRRPVLPRRRAPADQGQRAHHRGHAPGSRSAREAGPVPRGSVPPPERHPPAAARAARAARGHPAAREVLPLEERARPRRRNQAPDRRGAEVPRLARLPGQRAPAREPVPLAHRDGARHERRRPRPAAGDPRGRCAHPFRELDRARSSAKRKAP